MGWQYWRKEQISILMEPNCNTAEVLPKIIVVIVTIRGANTLLLRVHVQVPLSLKAVLDIFKYTMSGPLLKTYLPPVANTVPLLSLHRMVDEGLLLRFVPHTRVTGCPRTASTRKAPVVITGGTGTEVCDKVLLTIFSYIITYTAHSN